MKDDIQAFNKMVNGKIGAMREEISALQAACQEKDKQIADQDAYIAELEECMIDFMQDNYGSSCTEKEAREELTKMREEVALENIKQGDRKL